MTFKVKKGDTVSILAGKDRGKTGKVTQIFRELGRVVVDGVNMRNKHLKARGENAPGQKVTFPAPLTVSNVAVVCPKCAKPTRVGFKLLADGKKVRVCKTCEETF